MSWEMQVLVGATAVKQKLHVPYYEGGEWETIRPSALGTSAEMPPYRYDSRQDAEDMLRRLFPSTPAELLRVIWVGARG